MATSTDDLTRSLECLLCLAQSRLDQGIQWIKNVLAHVGATYASDIISFEIGILAILLPVGLDIITRISDRYKNDLMAKRASSHFVIRVFPYILIASILITVMFQIRNLKPYDNYDYCHSIVISLLFIFNCICTCLLIRLIWKYAASKSNLLFHENLINAKNILAQKRL